MPWTPIILGALALGVILLYNRLVQLRVRAAGAWSDIDVQLKRRHDLIPNLVETVKGYAGHERETLEAVIQARSRAVGARDQGPAERAQAENFLAQALRQLFALAEAYPDLKAAANFRDLQASLRRLEDAIQNARRYYNAVVRDLNTKIQQFPSNLVALTFSFKPREFFEIEDAERAVPEVRF